MMWIAPSLHLMLHILKIDWDASSLHHIGHGCSTKLNARTDLQDKWAAGREFHCLNRHGRSRTAYSV